MITKLFKAFLIKGVYFSMLLLLGCTSSNNPILINQIRNEEPITLRLTLVDSTIYGFKIPNRIKIKNNSFTNKSFIMVDYFYNDSLSKWRNLGIELYSINNNKLKRISNNEKKTISPKDNLELLYYTRHFIDSAKTVQNELKSYVLKMLSENKDTLHIGTVSEFKAKHGDLFEKLTEGDSISIRFLKDKKMVERITVPVEW